MRLLRGVLVLAILLGLVWIGQGMGLIPGSFMTGRIEWAVIGSLVMAVALIGFALSLRGRPT